MEWTNRHRPSSSIPLKGDDIVTFSVGMEDFSYQVESSYLNTTGGSGSNSEVFEALGVEKNILAEKLYGYAVTEGRGEESWPESQHRDYGALTRLVCYLFDLTEKPRKKKGISLEATKALKNLLKENDWVKFNLHDDRILTYRVAEHHLRCTLENDAIFNYLQLSNEEKFEWASRCYGYPVNDGIWPQSRTCDYEALSRFVEDIQRVISEIRLIDQTRIGSLVGEFKKEEIWNIIENQSTKIPTCSSSTNFNSLQNGQTIKTSTVTPSVVRGEKRTGRRIRGKTSRTSIVLGYLSNREITG